jgi:hypothetical protein
MFTFTGEPGMRMTRWTCRECGESGFVSALAAGRPWDIEAHRCRETWSDRVNYLWAREHLEALALVQDAQDEQIHLAVIGGPAAWKAPRTDPVQEILAAINEPLGLDILTLDRLAPFAPAETGPCRCWHCRNLGRAFVLTLLLACGMLALLWAAGVIR